MDDYCRLYIVLIISSFGREGMTMLFPETYIWHHMFLKKPDSTYDLNSADNTDVARPPYVPKIKAL